MLKKLAVVVGVVLLLIGVLGFVPALAPKDDMGMPLLLGLFMVGGIHNVIHLLSGAAALAAGLTTEKNSRIFFQVFGVVYTVVALVGIIQGDTVLGIIPVNLADNLLHVALALVGLVLGFGVKASGRTATV